MNRKDWDITDWKVRCSELAFEVERLWKEVEEWKQENKSLLKDQERLEWLAKSGAKVDRRTEHSGYIVTGPCHALLGKQDHDDWRDAIDEAMEDE